MADYFATPWTVTHQAPLSMGFPSPGHLPNPGIKLASRELTGRFFTTEQPGKPSVIIREIQIKTTIRYHLTPVRMTIIKKSTNNKCCRECVLSNFDQWLPKTPERSSLGKKKASSNVALFQAPYCCLGFL